MMSAATTEPSKLKELVRQDGKITYELPKLAYTNVSVIGNSEMRGKRERRHRNSKEPVWRVPRLVQTNLAAKIGNEAPLDTKTIVTSDRVGMSVKRRRPFRHQGSLNFNDRASVYAARPEDSFKGFEVTHTPRMVTLVDDRFKTEKRYIAKFYRQRSSALLSPIQKKRPSRTVSISLPSVVQEYDLTDATEVRKTNRVEDKRQSTIQLEKYHTRECLFCDVAGQKYCSECRRKHRHMKMKESNPNTVKFPKLPSCRVQERDSNMSSIDEIWEGGEREAVGSQRHRHKDWRKSSSVDEKPAHFKGSVRGKRRNTKAKYTTLPRIDLPAITTDTDDRHL